MDVLTVECLRCGELYGLTRAQHGRVREGECPRCGYLGWAPTGELSESTRQSLRERPVEQRRLRVLGRRGRR